MIILKLFIL